MTFKVKVLTEVAEKSIKTKDGTNLTSYRWYVMSEASQITVLATFER